MQEQIGEMDTNCIIRMLSWYYFMDGYAGARGRGRYHSVHPNGEGGGGWLDSQCGCHAREGGDVPPCPR